jgi:hypothetical protein
MQDLSLEKDWEIVPNKKARNNDNKKYRKKPSFYIKLHDKNVRDIPEEIISLYIGEILTMESDVQGVCNDLLGNSMNSHTVDYSGNNYGNRLTKIEDYDSPRNGHYEDVCMCKECFIWLEKHAKYIKKNPFIRYMHEFAKNNINVWTSDDLHIIYYKDDAPSGNFQEKKIIDLNGISHEKWIFQAKNETEKYLISLLLREYDPFYIRKYYSNWFKLLIKDRLPFRHSTVILYNVQNIIIRAKSYISIKLGIEKELEHNFELKPYKGNFTFLHIRFIRQRLLSLKFLKKKGRKSEKNRNKPFHLSKNSFTSDTHIDTEFINGILTIKICEQ